MMRNDSAAGALATLVCLTVFAIVFVVYTSEYLPERVATHFGASGHADGWMSRNGYIFFMATLMVGMSALVTFVVGTLPRKFPQWTNVPHRDYWLAEERREESLLFLSAHGKRLGYAIVMMMLAMHYIILLANRAQPQALPGSKLSTILIGFAIVLVWWIVRLYRRFPKPK
jgi:uncharacterized membrane protein